MAAVLVVGLTTGCGTAATASRVKPKDLPAGARTSSTATATATPENLPSAKLPPHFVATMAGHGYVLEPKGVIDESIGGGSAIEQARRTFPLFSRV